MKDLQFRGIYDGNNINVTMRCDMSGNQQDSITILQITDGETFSTSDAQGTVVQKYFGNFKNTVVSLKALKDHATDLTLDLYIMNPDGSSKVTLVDGSDSISES